jgi:hypothetical protein
MVMSSTEIQLAPFTIEKGWKENSPTRDVYDHLSSENATREMYEDLANNGSLTEATLVLSTAFARQLRLFLGGSPHGERETTFKLLMQHWAADPWRIVPWREMIHWLSSGFPAPQDPVLYALYSILRDEDDWKEASMENCQQGEDTCLQEWMTNRCLNWVDDRDLRRWKTSIDPFPRALIQHYVGAVDWEAVTRCFRSDRLQ